MVPPLITKSVLAAPKAAVLLTLMVPPFNTTKQFAPPKVLAPERVSVPAFMYRHAVPPRTPLIHNAPLPLPALVRL